MNLAIIAGDGIGPEVTGEAVKVLDAVLPDVEKTSYDLGARRFHATGDEAGAQRAFTAVLRVAGGQRKGERVEHQGFGSQPVFIDGDIVDAVGYI